MIGASLRGSRAAGKQRSIEKVFYLYIVIIGVLVSIRSGSVDGLDSSFSRRGATTINKDPLGCTYTGISSKQF